MRHHHRCPSLKKHLQILHNDALIVSIQCIGCLIKEDEFRILIHSTGYEDTLFLSLTQPMPFLSYFGVVTKW